MGSVVARCVDSVSFDKLDAPYLDRQTVRFCQATEESREPNASLPPETYDYEGIPTFPRAKADYSASSGRAADTGQGSHVPRDTDTAPSPASIDSIDSVLAKLESAGAGGLPRTFADLECLGVPPGVLSMLRMSLVLPAGEDEIVKAFLEALATWDAEASRPPILARHTSRAMRIVFAFPWSWHALRVEARRAVEHWHRLATIAEIGAASSRAPGEAAVAR